LEKSGTRSEELIMPENILKQVITLRRMITLLGSIDEKAQAVVDRLAKTKSIRSFKFTQ